MEIKTLGIDVGKTWFHLIGCNRADEPVAKHKLNRGQLIQFVANLPVLPHWHGGLPRRAALGTGVQRHGHDVRLMAPKFIKPYLKSQKSGFNDAVAIAETVERPTMRFVSVRSNDRWVSKLFIAFVSASLASAQR